MSKFDVHVAGLTLLTTEDVEQIVALVAEYVPIVGLFDLGIHGVPEGDIQALNSNHRGEDSQTDVLSFPIDGLEEIPEGIPRQLGDVMICEAYVSRQFAGDDTLAQRSNMPADPSLEVAVARCVVHGMLHLVGMDHERSEGDSTVMFEAEQAILDRWQREVGAR